MFSRLRRFSKKHSFFLFGPRGTGKITLLRERFDKHECLWLDLLDTSVEDRFYRNPGDLYAIVKALPNEIIYIVLDEIQKAQKLLDEVHRLIEETDKVFVLTGSSARKLKHGGANLLAGRAFVYHLYTFSYLEVEQQFVLNESLRWGMLPKIYSYDSDEKKQRYLEAYTNTYLREEIWGEQLVRNFESFRNFLEVAAQSNGKLINFSNIARDIGSTDNSVREYFSILEDTLIG